MAGETAHMWAHILDTQVNRAERAGTVYRGHIWEAGSWKKCGLLSDARGRVTINITLTSRSTEVLHWCTTVSTSHSSLHEGMISVILPFRQNGLREGNSERHISKKI
jgi:hypothetical protein